MNGSSFKVQVRGLAKLITLSSDPALQQQLQNIAKRRECAAIISQAIAENFAKRGPGWPPLKTQTILSSISKSQRAKIMKHKNPKAKAKAMNAARTPLQGKTRMLYKSVTTPGAPGNVYSVDAGKIIWGTNLVYAGIHNRGGVIKNGWGRGITIRIPKREYLKVPKFWMQQLSLFVVEEATRVLGQYLRRQA